jgi:hypothetical protein
MPLVPHPCFLRRRCRGFTRQKVVHGMCFVDPRGPTARPNL